MVSFGFLVLENYDKIAKSQEEYQENLKLIGYVRICCYAQVRLKLIPISESTSRPQALGNHHYYHISANWNHAAFTQNWEDLQ